jgi:hypothetical protein
MKSLHAFALALVGWYLMVVTYKYPPLPSLVSSVTIPLTRTAAMVITQ